MSAALAEAASYPTKVTAELTIEGAEINWRNITLSDLEVIVPRIEEHASNLKQTYRVRLDIADHSNIMLELEFKRAADRADLVRIKGDVFAVLVDTSWGGSG